MKIKICGITRIEDALLCSQHGADSIGFIFYHKSKRYISPESAKDIVHSLPSFLMKVGVFVNENISEVNRIAQLVGLNAVQLHGDESPKYIEQMTHPVIKCFGVDESFDFSIIHNYKNCDILLDVKNTEQFGGTGNSFNWNLIPDDLRNRVIIAGGVSYKNINEIYSTINPGTVDLASSVEISPGIKDKNKIIEILNIIRQIKRNEYER